ncbi:PP2C family protein-serine/threonine phosphatase [Sandarakinorhabdus sp. DWP1-3-1]|uniref:PP2C family protein-serine/threonine phosphatase n=1 Tax=Sandarakinorhabdus sp. DWP1-3-1 TaxID=2804627 RepID=UPI003CE95DB5
MIPLRTEWQAVTDTGLVRQLNEDRFFASEATGVWAVADGMGGHARGDWAAAAIVDSLAAMAPTDDFDALLATVADTIRSANGRIVAEAAATGSQMGSTIVALVVRDRRFGVIWAGDSRAYLLRNGALHRLSRDHSQVQELVDRDLLTLEGAATHPLRNVLTRAVGVAEPLELDMVTDVLLPDDVFMLCSDGLYGCLSDQEIAAELKRIDADDAIGTMVAHCLERGAPDNVTAITVVATEPTLLHFGSLSAGSMS